jgi:phage tail-like protein
VTASPTAPGWLANQLPRALSEDHFTRNLLRIFEDVGDSVRRPVLSFANNLDAGLAPMEFIRWMGDWLALTVPASLSEQRQRDLLSVAGAMWKLRGTRAALVRLLETITGDAVEIDDGGGVFGEGEAPPNSKRVVIDLAARGGLSDEQILEFVRRETPANVTVELRVGGRALAEAQPEPSEGSARPSEGAAGPAAEAGPEAETTPGTDTPPDETP